MKSTYKFQVALTVYSTINNAIRLYIKTHGYEYIFHKVIDEPYEWCGKTLVDVVLVVRF